MITITFTPETPEQLAAVAQAMAAYLGVAAQGDTVAEVADEAPKTVRRVRKPAAAEASASAAGTSETTSQPDPTPTETTQATDPKPVAEASEPEASAVSSVSSTAPEVSLEQVRAKLVVISQAGKGASVAALLTNKYGVKNLTAVPKDQLAALLADAEAL